MTALRTAPLRSPRLHVAPPPDPAVLFAALPIPCAMLDAQDNFRAVNPAAEAFFGLSQSQLSQLALADLLPADSPLFGMVAYARDHEVTVSESELTLESPRLSRRRVAIQAAPVPEHAGGVLLTFTDHSAARALDRQIAFRNAARSVAGMAAILAHEVKNPLSGIRGAAQLLEHSVAAEDRELAVLIRDEADRIRALVERMDAFGDKPVNRGGVNIHRVLDHVRRLAQTGFACGIAIEERYDPSLPPVWGNRDELIQVFLNLIKNAAEAIAEAGLAGAIALTTSYQQGMRLAPPGSAAGSAPRRGKRVNLPLLVTVTDTGPGIPPDVEKNLFDPFVTTKPAGSGLGLALVAKIIGDHGGLIEVDSVPGHTEFRVFLPVYPEDLPAGAEGADA